MTLREIANPIGYAATLAKKAMAGTFFPSFLEQTEKEAKNLVIVEKINSWRNRKPGEDTAAIEADIELFYKNSGRADWYTWREFLGG